MRLRCRIFLITIPLLLCAMDNIDALSETRICTAGISNAFNLDDLELLGQDFVLCFTYG
jgi:hypothetical protein